MREFLLRDLPSVHIVVPGLLMGLGLRYHCHGTTLPFLAPLNLPSQNRGVTLRHEGRTCPLKPGIFPVGIEGLQSLEANARNIFIKIESDIAQPREFLKSRLHDAEKMRRKGAERTHYLL